MGRFGFAALAAFGLFLSGAWWDRERRFSLLAGVLVITLLTLALDGCAVYHACREGLCR
jgi:hypothetical protein